MEATVALAKCRNGKIYGMRFEKTKLGWDRTWAFPINSSKTASKEGYDKTVISGILGISSEYPGCPYCKTTYITVCGACGKSTCWDGESKTATCQWCGNTGELGGNVDSMSTNQNY